MSFRIAGFVICLATLFITWWLFYPFSSSEERGLQQKKPVSFDALPLKVSGPLEDGGKLSVAEMETEDPKPSPFPASKTLSNEEIQEVFHNHQRQFQNCWVQRLKDNPKLAGKVSFRVNISPRGKVTETQMLGSTIDDALMLQCLNSTLLRFSFREFRGDPIEVIFPLEFEF